MANSQVIYGIHAVLEAIRLNKQIERVLIKDNSSAPAFKEIINYCRENAISFQFVPLARLDRITSKNHQGIVAYLSNIEYQSIEQLVPMLYEQGKTPFFLILDHITDVRNFGSIARTAECAGVQAIILPDKGSAMINEDAIKTSSGAIYSLNICRVNSLANTIKYLQNCGITAFAASEKGTMPYTRINFNQPVAIVMGAEGKGLSPEVKKVVTNLVNIPLLGNISSLNVSVAAGIILFEKVRQQLSTQQP
jgi:23S rRNA (guanosine2251-2'-O)-methyltransferase